MSIWYVNRTWSNISKFNLMHHIELCHHHWLIGYIFSAFSLHSRGFWNWYCIYYPCHIVVGLASQIFDHLWGFVQNRFMPVKHHVCIILLWCTDVNSILHECMKSIISSPFRIIGLWSCLLCWVNRHMFVDSMLCLLLHYCIV